MGLMTKFPLSLRNILYIIYFLKAGKTNKTGGISMRTTMNPTREVLSQKKLKKTKNGILDIPPFFLFPKLDVIYS